MRQLRIKPPGEGGAGRYEYYIIIDEVSVGAFSCESYGIRVRDPQNGAEAAARHVTVRADRIDELSTLLMRNEVGPVSLDEVVADWL